MEGVFLLSKARCISQGEKATSYLCNLENLATLIDKDDNILTDSDDIIIITGGEHFL